MLIDRVLDLKLKKNQQNIRVSVQPSGILFVNPAFVLNYELRISNDELPKSFLVPMARWNHTDSIPNSEVKRCCGDDSGRVADCENSSVPGF